MDLALVCTLPSRRPNAFFPRHHELAPKYPIDHTLTEHPLLFSDSLSLFALRAATSDVDGNGPYHADRATCTSSAA